MMRFLPFVIGATAVLAVYFAPAAIAWWSGRNSNPETGHD